MRCRFQWNYSIIIFLVFSFFLIFPVFAQAQNPSSTSSVEEKETTGEVDFTEADKEAISNLFQDVTTRDRNSWQKARRGFDPLL